MTKAMRHSLLNQFKPSRWEYLKIWGPAIALVVLGFVVASFFVKPAPPKRVVIATGAKSGAYYNFATQYAKHFSKAGIELVVKETAGSIENYKLLSDEKGDVTVAIVQGGTASETKPAEIEAVASLYLEPVWVFHRGGKPFTRMEQLKGRIIAVGADGSGVRVMSLRLLDESGVVVGPATAAAGGPENTAGGAPGTTRFEPLGGQDAADALKKGEIDAAIFVISPQSPIVRDLIDEPDIQLMSFDLAEAYTRRMPYLTSVRLPEGVIDMKANLPSRTVTLLAPAANLVVRGDVHSAVVPLLIEAAKIAHENGNLVTERWRADSAAFPSLRYTEFPVSDTARYYFENGPSFLYRVLPFWAASLIDRMKIFILPLLTLLLPMFRIAPPLYVWRIRRRIYRWYRVLRLIDCDVQDPEESKNLTDEIARLKQLDREVNATVVPLSYMQEFYQLRAHIEMSRFKILQKAKENQAAAGASEEQR